MLIRLGYELAYEFTQATPLLLNLHVHYTRTSDLVRPDVMMTDPSVPLSMYRDTYGNWCTRAVAPPGRFVIGTDALIRDSGEAEAAFPYAYEHSVDSLPEETLSFLLPSRYCETEHVAAFARERFGKVLPGWARVQAICDFVHAHVTFEPLQTRVTQTALETFNERRGGSRDFTHLGMTLCRCMNVPARYCTGYLGGIGAAAGGAAQAFASWFDAYIGGAWHTFDPLSNTRRVGRVLIARGRDSADVDRMAFGPGSLQKFKVWSDEVHALAA